MVFEDLMECKTTEDGKIKPSGLLLVRFILMTAFMAIVNYYFFFGQVVFLVLYFVIRYGVNNNRKNNNP